jgi:GT2 family glycosyltransferase
LLDWAQRMLPVAAVTKTKLGAARSWIALLELLLSDAELPRLSQRLIDAGVDRFLRDRLSSEAPLPTRSVVGIIDIASAFELRGWAADLCDKSQPVVLNFFADEFFLGAARCDEVRPDVEEVIGGNGQCGFRFEISPVHRENFGEGRKVFARDAISGAPVGESVVVRSEAGQDWDAIETTRQELIAVRRVLERIEARLPELGRQASIPIQAYNDYWRRFYQTTPEQLAEQRRRTAAFTFRPLISIVVPIWNSNTLFLDKAVRSVRDQSYDNWELIVADDGSANQGELGTLLRRHADADARIRIVSGTDRLGIAGNTNRGLAEAKGDYVAFLDHDDRLALDGLFHVVKALQEKPYDLVYSDEDRLDHDPGGRDIHHSPFFKPDFDPDLLLSVNYICHLVVLKRTVVERVGGIRTGLEGAQDHDLLLRAVATIDPAAIRHVPRILYHWRVTPGSVSESPGRTETIQDNIVASVADHLAQRGLAADVEPHADPVGRPRLFANRVRWKLRDPAPLVSIILPTRDRVDLLRPCIDSILDSAPDYPGQIEILLIDNDSIEPAAKAYFATLSSNPVIRILPFQGVFNWSSINNFGAGEARGEVLIFLNNDTMVLTRDWCSELVANAMRPDVGAVGARLLYQDGTIQHAGVVLGVEGVAAHDSLGETTADGGYYGRSQLQRSCGAVTGACLATRRDIFAAVGGFDDLALKVAFNDVDFCMKARRAGYRIVYNPFAVLYHLESKSRGRDLASHQQARHRSETETFRARWGGDSIEDPFYNRHFERYARPFDRLRPPPDP